MEAIAAHTPCNRSPRCRANTRCGGANRSRALPVLKELGIGFVPLARSPGDSSPARSATTDVRLQRRAQRPAAFPGRARQGNQAVVGSSARLRRRKRATKAQIALAWLLTQALDRSDPGDDETAPARRERRRGQRGTDAQASPANPRRGGKHSHRRRALHATDGKVRQSIGSRSRCEQHHGNTCGARDGRQPRVDLSSRQF